MTDESTGERRKWHHNSVATNFTILKELTNAFLAFWQTKKISSKTSVGKESQFDITKLANKTIYSDVCYFKEKVIWTEMERLNEAKRQSLEYCFFIVALFPKSNN